MISDKDLSLRIVLGNEYLYLNLEIFILFQDQIKTKVATLVAIVSPNSFLILSVSLAYQKCKKLALDSSASVI